MTSIPNKGIPTRTPKYHNPPYWSPQKGTPILGKPIRKDPSIQIIPTKVAPKSTNITYIGLFGSLGNVNVPLQGLCRNHFARHSSAPNLPLQNLFLLQGSVV